jgi:hypothetical protein
VIGTQIFGDLLLIRAAAVAQDLAAVVVAVRPSTTGAPGGLTWEEAADILHGLPHASGARGLEVTMTTRTRTPAGASVRHMRTRPGLRFAL